MDFTITLNINSSSGESLTIEDIGNKQFVIDQIKVVVESICSVVESGSANNIVIPRYDPDEQTRKDMYCFALYILMRGGSINDEDLEIIESGTSYRIDRMKWQQFKRKERIDSEARYLTVPPETIRYLVRLDNALYDRGYNCESAGMAMDLYRNLVEIFVIFNRIPDEERRNRVNKFICMVEKYLRNNVKNPQYKIVRPEGEERPSCEPF